MLISLIVAASNNGVIGVDGDLPWRLPNDLKRFKSVTMGKPIIMGRATYESIRRPLPGRQNIVVSRSAAYLAPGCDVVNSLQQALTIAEPAEEAMIIGGGQIYSAALPLSMRVYLTRVDTDIDGDTFFPALSAEDWLETSREEYVADETHDHDYAFVRFERRLPD